MDDRGDKIVTLAREMLRSEMLLPPERPQPASSNTMLSIRIVIATLILTAIGSSAVTRWAMDNQSPISRYEKANLDALVFYIARNKGIDEKILRQDLAAKMDVREFSDITKQDFPVIQRYLQEKAQ